MAQRIIITGGSGFIGTNLHLKLKKMNNKIINLDISSPKLKSLNSHWINCDIRNLKKLKKIFNSFKPNYVYHLAARTDLNGKKISEYNTNTVGTKNIIKLVSSKKYIKGFLYTSTRFVFNADQNPQHDFDYSASTVYGKSKIISEKYFLKNLKYLPKCSVLTRPTSIWGPHFSEPYLNFFRLIEKGFYIHPTNSFIYKSFGYVENTVIQMIELINKNNLKKGQIYYLCDYKPYEVYSFANNISKIFKKNKIIRVPHLLSLLVAFIGSTLNRFNYNFPLTLFRLRNMTTDSVFENQNLKKILKTLPFKMSKGIYRTCKWINSNENFF
jgi:GlcNAc-P-P-Und epimerase